MNPIYVFCRSNEPFTYGELAEQMLGMGFLDNPATIQPPVEDQNRVDAAWTGCELMYRTGRQPIIVRHWQTAARMDETIDEVREQLRSEPASDVTTELAMRLAQTRQVIVFEIDDDDVPEDVWEMLDASEGYIAGKLDGIVVAYEGPETDVRTWEIPIPA